MMTYEYKCEECNYYFIENRGINDAPAFNVCPKCRGRIHRTFTSAPLISFKGTGFHVNDYRKE